MANEKNLKPIRNSSEAREKGKKGGKASGKKRREQKAVREILSTILNQKARNNENFAALAQSIGVSDKKSVKEIYTLVCLLNSIKKADLKDLEILVNLLGENGETVENNGLLTELVEYLKNE